MANDNVSAQEEAELDEELMETFPASDAPSNTVLTGVGHSAAIIHSSLKHEPDVQGVSSDG